MQRTEVFAPGASIENSLRNMASRRTDIFGAGDEETDIGKKFGEEEDEGTTAGRRRRITDGAGWGKKG